MSATTEYRTRGDTWSFPMTVTDDATGLPYTGLATSTIVSTIRVRDTGVSFWSGSKAGGQIVVTNAATGALEVTVPSATTASALLVYYDMDVEVTTAAGVKRTVVAFALKATKDVTI